MSMNMKTVSIWAPLRYANYGDDMQAIAFALMIKKMGYNVKVFQLEEGLSKTYDLQVAADVQQLCEGVNLVIIAGGALLTPFSFLKRYLDKSSREYEADFRALYKATKKYPNVKFCAISFGGSGKIVDEKSFGDGRRKFFRSDSFLNGTVRLAGDVEMMKVFGKDMLYYADMLFQTPTYFPPKKLEPTHKYRVGFNFKRGKHLDKKLIKDIFAYAKAHDDMEFHFTTTHMEKVGLNYQYVPDCESTNIFIDHYENPCQLYGIIASMDCFMTSMLHVGLTGLTAGTPFISYRGPEKTRSFLRSIGGDWAILPDNISFDELKSKFWSRTREQLYNGYDTQIIDEMKKDSLHQYDFCRDIVNKFA